MVELNEHVGLAHSTVSAHLRCLLDCGVVQIPAQTAMLTLERRAALGCRAELRAGASLACNAVETVV